MAQVSWTSKAVADLESIGSYIRQFNPIAASQVATALIDTVNSLGSFSERGRPRRAGRREIVAIWPYVIRIIDDAVVIVRIRHGKRRPA